MIQDSANDSPRYRRFVNERDKALEQLHINAQKDISVILHNGLERILGVVTRGYSNLPANGFFTQQADHAIQLIDNRVANALADIGPAIIDRWIQFRKHAWLLATLSESEAIAHAFGKQTQNRVTRADLTAVSLGDTFQKENIASRVSLALSRIRRKVMDAVETSKVHQDKLEDALARVMTRAFPSAQAYIRPPRMLKPIKAREADDYKYTVGLAVAVEATKARLGSEAFVDDAEWDDLVDNYKSSQLPSTRFFNEPIDIDIGDAELEEWYAWEIEKELTHDFVDKVRKGQVDAANKAGISDFVWIAVIDSHTDDCCAWRDGLTTTEIQAELEGKHRGDECDATEPPAHYNCRCALAPVGEIPERIELDLGEFDEWLSEP